MLFRSAIPAGNNARKINDVIWSALSANERTLKRRRQCICWAGETPNQVAVCWQGNTVAQAIPEQHIFVAEAQGFELALQVTDTADTPRVFVSDNRALHLALRKGRSSNAYVNRLIYDVLQQRLAGRVLSFLWVPSAENLADSASRMDLGEHAC